MSGILDHAQITQTIPKSIVDGNCPHCGVRVVEFLALDFEVNRYEIMPDGEFEHAENIDSDSIVKTFCAMCEEEIDLEEKE